MLIQLLVISVPLLPEAKPHPTEDRAGGLGRRVDKTRMINGVRQRKW